MSACMANTSAIVASSDCVHRLDGATPAAPTSTSSGETRTRAGCPPAEGSERTVPVSRYFTPSSRATSGNGFFVPRYSFELARAITWSPGTPASLPRISSVMPSTTYASSGRPRFSNGSTAMRGA
jgi:hypothetical protein